MELLFLPVILIVLFMLYQKGKFDKGEYKNNILVYLTWKAGAYSNKEYDLVARTCLSHTAFKYKNEVIIVGKWNGTIEQYNFSKEYLSSIEENNYDKLSDDMETVLHMSQSWTELFN